MAVALEEAKLPPGPKGFLPVREIAALRRDTLGFLSHMSNTYGDVSCIRLGPQLIYLVRNPELVHETLVVRHASLEKTWIIGNAEEGLGKGMLTSTGELHRRQRKLIQPALHRDRVHAYAETMIRNAVAFSDTLEPNARIDMATEMRRLTLMVVAQTLFGSDMGEEANRVGESISELAEIYKRVTSPLGPLLNRMPFLPGNRRFEKAKQQLDESIYQIIDERKQSGERHDDLLGMLLDAKDEDGNPMPESMVRDETVSLFLAGHETTGITLTWAWCMIAQHPDVEREFHRELENVLGDRMPRPDDLNKLTFTRMIVAETTRLYPAIYVVPRRAIEPCTLDGYYVKPGALVFVNIYDTHRDERFFPDPDRFDPHRWTDEMKANLPRYAHCAFGGGPHSCMGEHFAWTEAMLVLATVAQRWRFSVVPGHTVRPAPLVNLRPHGGMPMVVAER